MHPTTVPTLRRFLFVLLIALAACTPARREIGKNMEAVRHIRFTGNGGAFSGQNDLQLEEQLAQKASNVGLLIWPLMYWVDPVVLNEDLLRKDAYRLEVWYAHHGWFDARFEGWEIQHVRKNGRHRGGVVDIRGILVPGPQSSVTNLSLSGLDKPRFDTLKDLVRTERLVRTGDAFDLSYAEADRALIEDLLFGTGFPYATVDMDIQADPEQRSVDIAFEANTGIHARFGEARVHFMDEEPRIREHQILDRLTFEAGKEYQVDRLRETQADLFEMGTFSSVRVQPDLSDPAQKDVPIDVYVAESKWRTLRFGLGSSVQKTNQQGLLTDGLAWSPRLSAQFRHANLFRQLMAFELSTSIGVYYEPEQLAEGVEPPDGQVSACFSKLVPSLANTFGGNPDDCPHTLEPTWSLGTKISWPRILGERWGIEYDAQIERNVFLGEFPLRRIGTHLSAVYTPGRTVQFRMGPAVEQAEYFFETDPQERRLKRVYGNGFENPYVLVAFDQRLIWDRRSFIRRTKQRNGLVYTAIGLRETLPTHPTAQRFIGTDVDTRYRIPVPIGQGGYELTTAYALRGEYLAPYADRDVAYPERAFLGGANSVRGFRTGQLGPYDAFWDTDRTVTYIPRGGTLALQGSAEVRYPWLYGITWATFVDVGALSEGFGDMGLDKLRYSGGVGFRYDTLVGPIRMDVSLRPEFPEDLGPTDIFPEGAGRPTPRSYDLISGLRPNSPHPPYAVVLFLAIGEAI